MTRRRLHRVSKGRPGLHCPTNDGRSGACSRECVTFPAIHRVIYFVCQTLEALSQPNRYPSTPRLVDRWGISNVGVWPLSLIRSVPTLRAGLVRTELAATGAHGGWTTCHLSSGSCVVKAIRITTGHLLSLVLSTCPLGRRSRNGLFTTMTSHTASHWHATTHA